MGNSTSKRSEACTEALLAFDSTETEALTKHFYEAVRTKQGGSKGETMDAATLQRYLRIGPPLGSRLFKAMALMSAGDSGRPKQMLSFDDFVVAVSKCCSSQRYERRAFWLCVMKVTQKILCYSKRKDQSLVRVCMYTNVYVHVFL